MTIFNYTDHTFTPGDQQAIIRAANYAGVEQVYTQRVSDKPEDSNLFHFYDTEEYDNYLFSLDIIETQIYDRR